MYAPGDLQARGFHWNREDLGDWQLTAPDGCRAATVWSNGTWSTWNCQGVGGENSIEKDVALAKDAALRAVALAMVLKGWHPGKKPTRARTRRRAG